MESAREIPRLRFRAGQIEQTPTPTLPQELVAEILSWLPVKSLLRFRCVSKFWRSFIHTKHFVKSNLDKSRKHPSFARHRIIAQSVKLSDRLDPTINVELQHFSLSSLLNNRPTYVSAFDDPLCASDEKFLAGSCDGLVCILSSTNNFFLWNPSTRIFIELPSVDVELNWWDISYYGFGLDESNGDYKVFCLLESFKGNNAVGKVYSLKTNSWRTIECMHALKASSSLGKFVSGKLHWLGSSYIVSFDLEKEVYGRVQLPFDINAHYDLELLTLGIVEECLCLLSGHYDLYSLTLGIMDIWVMKQYGVKESWTKVITVPDVCDSWDQLFLKPLFLGQNGEILLTVWPNFLVYSPKDKRAWNPLMHSLDEFRNAHVYIESLVSPVSSGEQ